MGIRCEYPVKAGLPPKLRFTVEGQTIKDVEILTNTDGDPFYDARSPFGLSKLMGGIGASLAQTQGVPFDHVMFHFQPVATLIKRQPAMLDLCLEGRALVVVDLSRWGSHPRCPDCQHEAKPGGSYNDTAVVCKGRGDVHTYHVLSRRRACSNCKTNFLDTACLDQLRPDIRALFPFEKSERSGLEHSDAEMLLMAVGCGVPVSLFCSLHNDLVTMAHARREYGMLLKQVEQKKSREKLKLLPLNSTPLLQPPIDGRSSLLLPNYAIEQFLLHAQPKVEQHLEMVQSRAHWVVGIDGNFKVNCLCMRACMHVCMHACMSV